MENRSAQELVMQRLGIRLSSEQSAELYYGLCNFLVAKDAQAYIRILKIKYDLLKEGVRLEKCEYLIMEIMLEMFQSQHPLILTSVAYVVKYKS
ncbi:hypothetical protein ACFS7Z_26330 [Pontibacter toksunensis]|uniref:Uncharacterized protein n=1 Tax=Pontibacter toksunensis TaxID=1332631 RepID=A0ABW6C221_9BACT